MLMFQQKRARAFAGSSSVAARSIWLTLRSGSRRSCGAVMRLAVDALAAAAVEVIEAGAGLADIAGHRRQQRAGAHDVAAHGLPLQPLAEPQQRRPAAVAARRLLDQPRRHAGLPLRPRPACRPPASARPRPSRRVCAARNVAVEQPLAGDAHAAWRRRARRRCRGTAADGGRPPRPSPWRTGSTTILVPRASLSQCLWACGAEADGLAPHTSMQAASRALRGSKP